MDYPLFLSCPKGLEYLLEGESKSLGLKVERVSPQGVFGQASLAVLYRLCLWSRVANRVQLMLFNGKISDAASMHQLCSTFPWHTIFEVTKTFNITFHGTNTWIRNTMYGAQLLKDGIVDAFRKQTEQRPNVERDEADIKLHAHLKDDTLTVSLDLSGTSLHQRGYRKMAGEAPIKENVAAAILMRANWPALYEQGYAFEDPCCGAGTFVIEAAMMAANIAPGLLRSTYGFMHWIGHDPAIWEEEKQAAQVSQRIISVRIMGSDQSAQAIHMAKANAELAGVEAWVSFEPKTVETCRPISEKGLILCNPPYGERLGEAKTLLTLYQTLGRVFSQYYTGWQAAVLTNDAQLARAVGLRSNKHYKIYNGPLECGLYLFQLEASNQFHDAEAIRPEVEMLINRLIKNEKHLEKQTSEK